jgi:cytochrome c peroxidase
VLEDQALVPMFGEEPVELGLAGREAEMLDRLRAEPLYQDLFADAFPRDADPFKVVNVVNAIAAFQRTLISADSPYDRYVRGDRSAMSESAVRGMDLFFTERVECFHCHGGPTFTDSFDSAHNPFDMAQFHNNGLYNIDGRGAYPPPNTGLHAHTGEAEDQGRFKAPTLRNIEVTAPYMHDGSIATLEEVVDHYAAGGRNVTEGPYVGDGRENPNKGIFVRGFDISAEEREDLLAFLRSLTDRTFLENPDFASPFE